ncbi:MAG TPA: phosphatase PAP2 family protein [Microlunatus sp.]|jgi:undecaprenyl-diphosphatase|nr:phosphatase PAP2 family protein [Microlunatus sp.]
MSATAPPSRTDQPWWTASIVGMAGFIVVLMLVMIDGGNTVDTTVAADVTHHRDALLSTLATAVTALGSPPVALAIGACAAALLVVKRRFDSAALLLAGLALTAGLVYLVKIAIARPRPSIGPATNWDFSFPSGHTTDGTVTWVLVAVLLTVGAPAVARRAAVAGALVLGLLIGVSRVYLGAHWVTDVLAGWALAAALISATLGLRRPAREWLGRPILQRSPAAPSIAPGRRDQPEIGSADHAPTAVPEPTEPS